MATTVHEPPKIDSDRVRDQGHSGNGWRNLCPSDCHLHVASDYSPAPSSPAIWVVLFAITMMFAAFSSALFVRKGSSQDWRTFTLPSILYFNTVLLLASSVTLEVSRRRVATFMGGRRSQVESPALWLYITLFLGLLFVAGQYIAWVRVRAGGLYLAPKSRRSFFHGATPPHCPDVLGGFGGVVHVIRKLS